MEETDNFTYHGITSFLNLEIDIFDFGVDNFFPAKRYLEMGQTYKEKFYNVINDLRFLTADASLLSPVFLHRDYLIGIGLKIIYLITYIKLILIMMELMILFLF